MNSVSVSYIIPYYCLDVALLKRCLKSVLAASARLEDFEIIIVDDGTPQRYGVESVIHSLECPNIRYYYQENAGLGAARNAGIDLAKKEYIQFIDSDDYLFSENADAIYSLLAQHKPDILRFDFKKVYSDESMEKVSTGIAMVYDGSGTDFMLKRNLKAAAWTYIFRSTIADKVRFPIGRVREDEYFTPRLFLEARRVIVTSCLFYAYYQRSGSIIHALSEENIQKNMDDGIHIARQLLDEAGLRTGDECFALYRRGNQFASDLLLNLICWSKTSTSLFKNIRKLKSHGLYPSKLVAPDWKHRFFHAITCNKLLVWFCWLIGRVICRK